MGKDRDYFYLVNVFYRFIYSKNIISIYISCIIVNCYWLDVNIFI